MYVPVYYPVYSQPISEGGYGAPASGTGGYTTPSQDGDENKQVREDVKPEVNALVVGDAAFRNGDYQKAIEQYEQSVVMDPGGALARFALGEALFVKGDYSYGAFVLRKGLELDGSWLDVDATKDKIYGKLADYATALNKLEIFTAAHPYDGAAKFVLGYEYFVTKQYDRAKEILTQARALGPDPAADLILEKIESRQAPAPAEKPKDGTEKKKDKKEVVDADTGDEGSDAGK